MLVVGLGMERNSMRVVRSIYITLTDGFRYATATNPCLFDFFKSWINAKNRAYSRPKEAIFDIHVTDLILTKERRS